MSDEYAEIEPAPQPVGDALEPADDPDALGTVDEPDVAEASTGLAEVAGDALRFSVLLVQLGLAALAMAKLSHAVNGAYKYVEGCADSVDRLAEKCAGLGVDTDTVAEHHEAAAIMRSVLEEADELAAAAADLSTAFEATAEAHEADYGSVAERAQSMDVDMADRTFYANP
ncbi:hypothetical protein AB0M05_41475 [Streptomyces violaceusniger]|uniref:hypothetical protein n=1 Tax=Streptomyces violaceusniger TaxID=68280 RepID=UPI003441A77D